MKLAPKPLAALAAIAMVATVGLSGCTKNEENAPEKQETKSSAPADGKKAEEKPAAAEEEKGAVKVNARPDECGLQEQQGPEASFGPFDGSIHFFQPGEMAPNPNAMMKMRKYADSQMHLELDLKANEFGTNWGYAMDETPANLPIMYQLSDASGKAVAKGMMTPMNAIDGSHYGTNLPKDTIKEPGKYMMKITIYPPKNYDMHKDYITGVPADGWFKPLTADMPWEITQKNLDIVKENTVADPMAVPEKCKEYPVKLFKDETAEKALKAAEDAKPLPMMDHM